MTCEKMRENDDLSAFSDEDLDFVHENFHLKEKGERFDGSSTSKEEFNCGKNDVDAQEKSENSNFSIQVRHCYACTLP